MSTEAFRSQIETTLFGPVTSPGPPCRSCAPSVRTGDDVSSTAGIASTGDFLTAYAASKFGVEGFMEGLAPEVAPFGIRRCW